MGEKIRVPYFVIGVYAAFVVTSCLLVGILPALVNLPTCKDSKNLDSALNNNIEHANIEHNLNLNKRDVSSLEQSEPTQDQKLDINRRISSFSQKYPGKIQEVTKRYQSKGQKISKAPDGFDICPEILQPEPGVQYPWYSQKLPDNLAPLHYDLELFVPQWGLDIYDGFIYMHVNVSKPTQYILVHAALEIPLLQEILDSRNKSVDVQCVGEFSYFKNDYFIIKTSKPLQPSDGPIRVGFLFIGILPEYESGIFEFQFGKPGSESTMLASKFEPIDARKAYPCFDEPRFKATYSISIDHPKDTIALSNTPPEHDLPIPGLNGSLQTIFSKTPPMPSYLIAFVVFNTKDFDKLSATTVGDIKINLWARTELIDGGFADDALNMTVNIFSALLDIFRNVDDSFQIPKIDFFAIPEYPYDAIPHFGLPIFKENLVLFKYKTASERDLQKIALLIAKQLSEFWFGNYVTFSWWDELWLQEALGDYIKYRAVDESYPEWNILDQFITEELIYALVDDGYPSSHPISKPINSPYEIEEYFDDVETTKAAAILRMVEDELNISEMYAALTAYLNAHPWGVADINVFYEKLNRVDKWEAKDFFDRWTKQPNYPLLNIQIVEEQDRQFIKVRQSRALNSNSTVFAGDLLYPSPYDWVWFVPLTCSFGTKNNNDGRVHEEDFYIDKKEFSAEIENKGSEKYIWVHCDRKFSGYYATDYTTDNWENLGQALKEKNLEFSPEDRANIIHNLFINGFTERTSYVQVVDVLSYLNRESDYLPWRTVYKHLGDMISILDYKKSFYQVSTFFSALMREIEKNMDLWSPSGIHTEELLKETILSLACRLQDSYCLRKTSELWSNAIPSLLSGNYNTSVLPPFVREIVFNYHIQNTYNVEEWDLILLEYESLNDMLEKRRLLESLSFTRLPWLLSRLLQVQSEDKLERLDFFETIRLLSGNPLGREISWDYMRINFGELSEKYGEDDPRLGRMLLDITQSFENEFLFYELLEFVFFTNTGATANARFRALEIVSTNNIWLMDKEDEIIEAFGDGRKQQTTKDNYFLEQKKDSTQFKQKAAQVFRKKLNEKQKSLDGIFLELNKILF